MHLSKINEAFSHRIVEGSQYQWNCFGHFARFLDYESDYGHASVVFDSENQTVYEASVFAKDDNDDNLPGPYRWINPNYKDSWLKECKEKNVDPLIAYDDVKFIDLEVDEDFCKKAKSIFENLPFDKRIEIPIDLNDNDLLKLMMEAHRRDITLNQLLENILTEVINNNTVNETPK